MGVWGQPSLAWPGQAAIALSGCPRLAAKTSAAAGPTACPGQLGYPPPAMEPTTLSPTEPARRSFRGLVIAAFVLATGVFVWNQLPEGSYPTDLSRIGQGQATLVLTMNGNFTAGAQMMPVLDTLRPEFAGQAQFLVASMGLPEGQAFAQQNQTADGSVAVFSANGARVAVLHGPRSADELRQALQLALQR